MLLGFICSDAYPLDRCNLGFHLFVEQAGGDSCQSFASSL